MEVVSVGLQGLWRPRTDPGWFHLQIARSDSFIGVYLLPFLTSFSDTPVGSLVLFVGCSRPASCDTRWFLHSVILDHMKAVSSWAQGRCFSACVYRENPLPKSSSTLRCTDVLLPRLDRALAWTVTFRSIYFQQSQHRGVVFHPLTWNPRDKLCRVSYFVEIPKSTLRRWLS